MIFLTLYSKSKDSANILGEFYAKIAQLFYIV